jgi:hypothetical protein
MANLHARFRDAFAAAFLPFQMAWPETADVKAGVVGLRFEFASKALASAYLGVFAAGSLEEVSLSIRVLTPDEIDLSGLIPEPASRGRNFVDEAYVAVWYPDHCPVLYLLDRAARRGIVWLPQRQAPKWELSRPACPLIQASLFDGPWTVAHGGAVGRNGRVLLLAGKGNAGKTTAALACAEAGWDYAGDDYILANSRTGRIEPLYTSARLRIDMAGAFAHILPAISRGVSHDNGDSRHELALGDILGPTRSKGGQLTAILLPRRQGASRPEFTPARYADAFHALFVPTSQGVPGSLKTFSKKLSALVALAPAFFVDTGQVPSAIPDAFAAFFDRLTNSG